jgi:hypothetical protein
MPERWLDPWFRENAHVRPAVAVEPVRFLDPSFRELSRPLPKWLEFDDQALARRVAQAWNQGRLLAGKAVVECVDKLGDLIRCRDFPLQKDVAVHIDHDKSAPVGRARLFRRQDYILACVVLADSVDGYQAARAVRNGTYWGLSIAGNCAGGKPTDYGRQVLDFDATELSLTSKPAGRGTYLLNMNSSHFASFRDVILGLTEKELPL